MASSHMVRGSIAAWPIYAGQQLNAFQVVKEIKISYRRNFKMQSDMSVSSKEIGQGIRALIEEFGVQRRKMK
ncbi:hypothetical protein MLD38_024343 [Melastoma candidum]|uniref:Uncharacterized protein n=1 Tax=Melastoma candidum TaxID=119954 RepID=A0ACB9NTB2_9MYRT|nr:hypothetical protein MLD38_024343 [Melastoma candidum]